MNLSRKLAGQYPRMSRGEPESGAIKLLGVAALLVGMVGCNSSGKVLSVGQAAGAAPSTPDIVRFLEQATFGATQASIQEVQTAGSFDAWLTQQFGLPANSYPNVCYPAASCQPGEYEAVLANRPGTCQGTCQRDGYTLWPMQTLFWSYALGAPDQLRQRVTFALDQIIVTSGADPNMNYPSRMTGFVQVLMNNAFGNFQNLLRDVTLNPAMGRYLDMIDDRADQVGGINENYGREIMQLFSIGLYELNDDGTVQTDPNTGQARPSYDQATIVEISRALSGWVLATPIAAGIPNYRDQLVPGAAARHDDGDKTLFGQLIPGGQGIVADLDQAIGILFNHHNVGPFIGKNLIQQLVTSNPSGPYVARVTSAFNDDGTGTRGNMQAVIRAILTDDEARNLPTDPILNANYGKLREPVLALSNLLRNFDGSVTTDYAISDPGNPAPADRFPHLDEEVFRAPTVFNFFLPDYPLPGRPDGSTLVAPEFNIFSTLTSLGRMNFIENLIYGPPLTNPTYRPDGTAIDTSTLEAMAGDIPTLVEAVNQQLLHGQMSGALRNIVTDTVSTAPAGSVAKEAVYLVATSPEYQVQR